MISKVGIAGGFYEKKKKKKIEYKMEKLQL